MAQQYPVNLQKDEVVIKLLRRHPVRVILEILVTAIIALILLAVLGWLYSTVSFFSTLWIILIALVILGAVITVFMDFYRYRHDLWMITNQRIVDSTRRSPFHHTLSTADLINVRILTSTAGEYWLLCSSSVMSAAKLPVRVNSLFFVGLLVLKRYLNW